MAKKISVKTSWYAIDADVVVAYESGAIIVEHYAGVNFTRSRRENAAYIREKYEDEGFEIIAIRNMTSTLQHTIHTYTINATNDQIIDACIAAGLDVHELDPAADVPTDESDNA